MRGPSRVERAGLAATIVVILAGMGCGDWTPGIRTYDGGVDGAAGSGGSAGGTGGSGGVPGCPTGLVDCGGVCVDLADPKTCGRCDNACAEGLACNGGQCVQPCRLASTLGNGFACGYQSTGASYCWGSNNRYQMGTGTTTGPGCNGNCYPVPNPLDSLGPTVSSMSIGDGACALKNDGTVWCWGPDYTPTPAQITPLGNAVQAISLGGSFACALKTDGSVWCWGRNDVGQLGDGTMMPRMTPGPVSALPGPMVQVTTGLSFACARKGDGTLYCWGANGSGQVADGTMLNRAAPVQLAALGSEVVDVTAGWNHACAKKRDGSFWCWGSASYGDLGNGSNIGSIDCSNACELTPVRVTVIQDAVTLRAGTSQTCAITRDRSVYCWGELSIFDNSLTPVFETSGVLELSLGYNSRCVTKIDGTLWCRGDNGDGQLGAGTFGAERKEYLHVMLSCP